MAKTNKNRSKETNGTYFLKLVLYLILGSLWIKVTKGDSLQIPLPVGLMAGLIFASHEHFQIDKKIEYAILLVSAFVGFWLPLGLYISF